MSVLGTVSKDVWSCQMQFWLSCLGVVVLPSGCGAGIPLKIPLARDSPSSSSGKEVLASNVNSTQVEQPWSPGLNSSFTLSSIWRSLKN